MELSPNANQRSNSYDFDHLEALRRLKDAHESNVSLLNRHANMIETNRDINSLHHAEAVIERQHTKILHLMKNIDDLNLQMTNNLKLSDQAQQKLLQDNATFNDYIIKLEGDLQISLNKSQAYLEKIKNLEAKIAKMDSLMLSKDTETNQSYQINHKLKIRNSELELKYQELQSELYKVKEERDKFAAYQADNPNLNKNDIHCKLKRRDDLKDLAIHMGQVDGIKNKCIIQLENDLLTYKKLCQRQCEEIKQLSNQIEQTKLVSPGNDLSSKIMQCFQKQMLHLSNDVQMQTRVVQEYQMLADRQLAQLSSLPLEDKGVGTAIKILTDLKNYEMEKMDIGKILCKIEDSTAKNNMLKARVQILNPYYSCYVFMHVCQFEDGCTYDAARILGNDNNPITYNMNVCVCADKLFIFDDHKSSGNDDKDNFECIELFVKSIKSVAFTDKTFRIGVKNDNLRDHLHIICKNEDEFNRLYFSLCYNKSVSSIRLNGCQVFGEVGGNVSVKLPILFFTSNEEIVGSICYNADLNIIIIYSINASLKPLVVNCVDYLLYQVVNVDDVAFSYYSMYAKCNIGHLYSLQRAEMNGIVRDAIEEAEKEFITSSRDQYYYLTSVNESDIETLDKILETAKWHECVSENPGESPHQNENEYLMDDENEECEEGSEEQFVSSITPFKIENGLIYLNICGINDESQGMDVNNCSFTANPEKNELSILVKYDCQDREMYIFYMPSRQDFEYWKNELAASGAKEENMDVESDDGKLYRSNSIKENQQACVVTKGQMQLFKEYIDDNSTPLLTYFSAFTNVTVREDKREIVMESTSKEGNKSRITLDCTNPKEFVRWKSALILAGFITDKNYSINDLNMLKKYVFPIKLFKSSENNDGGRRAFVITPKSVALFSSSTAKVPYLYFKKTEIDIMIFANDRRIRLYVNRYSKSEERFDFILPLMKDFSTVCAEFKSFSYKVGSGDDTLEAIGDKSKVLKNAKFPFVLAKPGTITLHLTMYTAEAEVTIKTSDYLCNIVQNKLTIEFTPKSEGVKSIPPLIFKKDESFKKWLLTLKISGFLKYTNEKVPRLYFPAIFYGHISPESIMLSKNKKG